MPQDFAKKDKPLISIDGFNRRYFSRIIFWVFAIGAAINLLMLAMPLYSLQVFSRAIPSSNFNTLFMLTIVVVLCLTLIAVLEALRTRVLTRAGNALEMRWRRRMAADTLDSAGRGRPESGPLSDLLEVKAALSRPTLTALMDLPWVPLYLVGIWLIHPLLGGVMALGIILISILGWIGHAGVKDFAEEGKAPNGRAHRLFDALLQRSETVRGLRMGGTTLDAVERDQMTAAAWGGMGAERSGVITAATKWTRMILQIAVTGISAVLVMEHHLSFGGMIATTMLVARGMGPVEQLAGSVSSALRSIDAWRRLSPVLKRLSREPERFAVPVDAERLNVENLLFVAPGDQKPILRSVNLTIEPGEVVCIAGPNRSGKSVLARLLAGVTVPSSGTVRLGGMAVHQLNPDQPDMGIGYLAQSDDLLPGTIAENIARFREATQDEVEAAAKAVGIHGWIESLPAGYQTEVGGFNSPVTGGTARLIALARAAFGAPPLLVLDEPALGLDETGIKAVRTYVTAARERGATTIIVTHSPVFVDMADHTFVLKNGMANELPKRTEQPGASMPGPNLARLRSGSPAEQNQRLATT